MLCWCWDTARMEPSRWGGCTWLNGIAYLWHSKFGSHWSRCGRILVDGVRICIRVVVWTSIKRSTTSRELRHLQGLLRTVRTYRRQDTHNNSKATVLRVLYLLSNIFVNQTDAPADLNERWKTRKSRKCLRVVATTASSDNAPQQNGPWFSTSWAVLTIKASATKPNCNKFYACLPRQEPIS